MAEDRTPALHVATAAKAAGAMTMVALCFANGLQGGMSQTFAQATDAIKHSFHVKDAVIGIVPFGVGLAGNFSGVAVAAFCARRRRVLVLAAMFLAWGVLVAVAGLTPPVRIAGLAVGFAAFAIARIGSAAFEATDPAALSLIADWWPVERRAGRVSVFNTLSAVGAVVGLAVAGVLVDKGLWRVSFVMWLPLAGLGAFLMLRQTEPSPGAMDVAFEPRLEELADIEPEVIAEAIAGDVAHPPPPDERLIDSVREVGRIRSWRTAALGIALTGLTGTAVMNWGIAYFKRTFHLSGVQAAGLAPVLGIGAFAGVLGGGFLADRLLARGVLRARLYVTAFGFASAGVVYVAAFSTTRLWIAAPLQGVAAACASITVGPQFAMLMDVTPARLRPQASAALNVLQASGALGSLLVGILSTLFGENLRLALLCVSPFYFVGGALVLKAGSAFVDDVAAVVADAASGGGRSLDNP